ncbi:MAG: molybdate ABC transporter substrate-binding protein [Pseudomonadota bacterium]|nr:molybdate ABC transporter substrate-binding protein [Pseudomonadota bacterium]
MRKLWRTAAAALGAGLLIGSAASAQTLTVAADTSLTEAMPALARGFEAAHPGAEVKVVLGASGTLLERIGAGLPADVLASADAETATLGIQRQLIVPDLRSVFATNTLVLITPASLTLPLRHLSDLTRPEVVRIAIGRRSEVPAGRYARQVIDAARLWPSVQRKVVEVDTVRDVLNLVAQGDVEAGFVFTTDVAHTPDRVRVVETLEATTPIRYPAHVVAASRQPALARAFVEWLRSAPARAVLQQAGFGLP